MGIRNNILLHYHYRLDKKLGKGVCGILLIPCACPARVAQLDKYWVLNYALSSQPRSARVEIVSINKYLNISTIGSSKNSLTNMHPN